MKRISWQTAVHESGHAITSAAVGESVRAFAVCPDSIGLAAAVLVRRRGREPADLRAELTGLAGGLAAEQRGGWPPIGTASVSDDLADMRQTAKQLLGAVATIAETEAEIECAVKAAAVIVDAHWPRILKVAKLIRQIDKELVNATKAPENERPAPRGAGAATIEGVPSVETT